MIALVHVLASLSFVAQPARIRPGHLPSIRRPGHLPSIRRGLEPSLSLVPPPQHISSLILLAENDGESTRPVRDLVENDAAVAYLVVLAVLFSFLAYLAVADQRAKRRKEEDMRSVMAATESLREQGNVDAAKVLEREMRRVKKAETKAAEAKGFSLPKPKQPSRVEEEAGNRFDRRVRARSGIDDDGRPIEQDEKPKKRSRARAGRQGRAKRR